MRPLRSGYTTGSCAAAAAKAAALLLRDGCVGEQVLLTLPGGEQVAFALHSAALTDGSATCSVIKDAGDDPDVTNGAEVTATISAGGTGLVIAGGAGIGRVTKPGLAIAVGEWAINPVPHRMIAQALQEVLPEGGLTVTISIPDGAQRALKTLNARLGIVGGLSILGTTGIVRPISAQAWTDTIDTSLAVARACGCPTVVLCTGRTSEQAAMRHLPQLQEEAFIMMGDHVQHALQACVAHGYLQPVLACQFAKLVKIACGHANTHAANSRMELDSLCGWLQQDSAPPHLQELARQAHTARELALTGNYAPELLTTVCRRVVQAVARHAPQLAPSILVCGYDGQTTWPHPRNEREK